MKKRSFPPDPRRETYSGRELYEVFQKELFSSARRMDTSLLRETVLILDEQPEEKAAPHRTDVWNRISDSIAGTGRPARFNLPRRAVLIAVAVLILLMTGVAAAVIDWPAVFRHFYQMEQRESQVGNWSLQEKRELADALQDVGYDMSQFPSLEGKSEQEQDQLLSEWIMKQSDGEVNARFYNVLVRLKGIYDSWSLEDKAWFDQLRLEGGEVQPGEFVSCLPGKYTEEERNILFEWARDEAHSLYAGTAAEPDTWTPYLFFGYLYPEEETRYWKIHFRGENLENEMTVLVPEGNVRENDLIILMQTDVPEDVG